MKILIVDDEDLARSRLARFIEKAQLGEVIASVSNGVQAIEAVEKYLPDVVLLDIQMPVMDGLEAARHISQIETPPAIIFCTAYDEYALEAFNVQAGGYLLKPVRQDDLVTVFSKLKKINKVQAVALNTSERRTHISAKTHQGLQLIPIEHILLFKAEQKYISVIHKDGELLIDEPLKDLEEEFADDFIRVHRNSLVRKTAISGFEKNDDASFSLRLTGYDELVPISRRHVAPVRKLVKAL
ncbi:LytTR family DNA-binding domain-containing protein [Oceaniserpentilla sp. 4NH20-0058]|uniref:LytR/AlgR family response regulator transcription factor n=1 Tax=Oceaniserpentilla sp. 4NH20-0058 TaxID=3127660 RepID=UPI00310A7790